MNHAPHNFSRGAYRLIFILAGVYHVAFGLLTVVWPTAWSDFFGTSLFFDPVLWQCFGLLAGLYGLLCWRVAWRPEGGRRIVAAGLLVKILVPIFWVLMVSLGKWPIETFPLIAMNDLLWWVPFLFFLLKGSWLDSKLEPIVPWLAIVLLLLASPATFLVREGTRAFASEEECIRFIETHLVLWRSTWLLVAATMVSLALMMAWWGAQLEDRKVPLIAFGIEAFAIAIDFLGIAFFVGWLPQHFGTVDPIGVVLTAGVATAMHAVAGGLLTWVTPGLSLGVRITCCVTWAAGFCISIAALTDAHTMIIVASAVMWSLLPLVIWLIQRHLRARSKPLVQLASS